MKSAQIVSLAACGWSGGPCARRSIHSLRTEFFLLLSLRLFMLCDNLLLDVGGNLLVLVKFHREGAATLSD